MNTLWSGAILPAIVSGLIVFLSVILGGGFRGWAIAIAIAIVVFVVLVWPIRYLLEQLKPFLAKRVAPLFAQRDTAVITNHLSYVDVEAAVESLPQQMRKAQFIPDLVIGVDRGGAAVGGMLAKLLNCPFTHMASSPSWTISTADGSLDDGLKEHSRLAEKWRDRIRNILIVDDACREGGTLERAVANFIGHTGFIRERIKTAVILDELRPHKAIRVDFRCFTTYRTGAGVQIRLPWDLSPLS